MSNKSVLPLITSEDKILLDRGYKLDHTNQIGEGGYAKVYLGEFRLRIGGKPTILACKVVSVLKARTKYASKFLVRELKLLVRINHPHIIAVHSIFYRKMKYYIFMRYAELGDLLNYMKVNGAVKQNQARAWVRQIALAIQYLHILEIAHRDLKCENILITANYNVKVCDFGFAKYTAGEGSMKTLSETFCGSLSYIPPEILRRQPYDAKIGDMWSFGVVIYIMVNKMNPFDTKNTQSLYKNQMRKNWKFRSKYAARVSAALIDLIKHLLEPNTNQRYTIEDVLKSSWIAEDTKLKVLGTEEYQALSSAMQAVRSLGYGAKVYEEQNINRVSSVMGKTDPNRNSLTIFKKYDKRFDIQNITPEAGKKFL